MKIVDTFKMSFFSSELVALLIKNNTTRLDTK